jgi:DNA repair exonuclease SbcCD ATPase subunit
MRLIRLEVQNFCQHRHVVVEFHSRLNAFLGNNGSGKSNLLTAALGALINDFGRTHGKKAENICQLAPEHEPSFVQLTFEHAGTTATVQRNLRGSVSFFELAGEDRVEGDRAVTARVTEILETNQKILDDYVFVEQGAIFTPLVAKSAERSRAFQQLFGTDQAERCWRVVGDYLADLEVPDVAVSIDYMQASLREAEGTLGVLTEELSTTYGHVNEDWTETADPDAVLMTQYEEIGDLISLCQELNTDISDSHAVRDRAQDRVNKLETDLVTLEEAMAAEEDLTDTARVALATWDAYKKQKAAGVQREADLEELLDEYDNNQHPDTLAGYLKKEDKEYGEFLAELDGAKGRRSRLDEMMKLIDAGESECPTCSAPMDYSDAEISVSWEELIALNTKIDRKHSSLEDWKQYEISLSSWNAWYDGWQKRKDLLEEQEVVELPEPTADKDTLKQIVSDYEEWEKATDEIRTELIEANGDLQSALARTVSKHERLDEISARLAELPAITDVQATDAAARLQITRARFAKRSEVVGQIRAVEQEVAQRSAELLQAQNDAVASEATRAFATHLQSARSVLHRDNLPRIVAQNYLELLQTDTNELLTLFDSDFRVTVVDGLNFGADFADGRYQPVARLSGGQKVVLALAFRIAVNALFANKLSLLCLDEPTAYLDDDNIGCLAVALDKLKTLSESRGLQCILITHERELGHLFDHVVQL